MTRDKVYAEIREMLGEVPSFFQKVPDSSLELEWATFKRVQFDAGPIPNKYRELLGIAVAAAHGCAYCAFFHTEAARLNGATDEEIEDAVHFAKSSVGWSTYVHGMQIPLEEFKAEVRRIAKYVREHQPAAR
jgi:AhpD family alkylhydroperoxidase